MMFRMILITLFLFLCTKFLQPLCKGDNGWLVVAIIALLVIAWLIILKKTILTARTVSFMVKTVKQ